ncbi:MAG: SLBB domain-containing protein [Gracilimonas sp.]
MTKNLTRLLLLLLLIGLPVHVFSQNGDQNQNSRGLDLQFNSTLGGYYYIDALSGIAQERLTPIEGGVDDTYVLGPNDIISISIDASEDLLLRALLINSTGEIVIPQIGTLSLEGKTIAEAAIIINNAAKKIVREPSTNVTLEFAKENTIHITGGVQFPGKYVLPPFTRVDEALYDAVYETYQIDSEEAIPVIKTSKLLNQHDLSLRNIKILHKDGSKSKADLFAYFKAGKISHNPLIQNGDQIIVNKLPRDSYRIGISGAVNISYNLEYSKTDTPALLLEMAGGFKPEADTSKILIYRKQNGETNKIEVSRKDWDHFELLPNDRIIVPTNRFLHNSASAWVYGEVDNPGSYPIKNGETTALDLLELTGDLTKNALPSAAYLLRAGSLENEIPNKFNTDVLKRTSDQLAQGFEYLDLETRLSQNKVYVDLNDDDQLSKVKMYDGDRLFVPRDEETIFVFGQVNNPGYYPYTNSNQKVSDYIKRAGGFALSANNERIFILKAGSGTWYKPNETTLESGDRIFVDRIPYDELNAQRNYEVQREQIKNTRIQLIMAGVSTITGIITTYVAIQNIRN